MHAFRRSLFAIFALLGGAGLLQAAGGTSHVAGPGGKITEQAHWPDGLVDLLNHATRTHGWNPWFTEWPNDVVLYQFEVKNTQQANEVLALFARVKADLHVHLALGKEPRGIGWVSKLDAGNNTAMLLSVGDQERMNQWYASLGGKKFGLMEFERCPIAVPPTFVIYVQNEAIDLDALRIPASVTVQQGAGPGLFHVSNLKPAEKAAPVKEAKPAELDAETKAAVEKIKQFLEKRRRAT